MQVTTILAGRNAVPFEAWATTQSGVCERIVFDAESRTEALALAFAIRPRAAAISVRRIDRSSAIDVITDKGDRS